MHGRGPLLRVGGRLPASWELETESVSMFSEVKEKIFDLFYLVKADNSAF